MTSTEYSAPATGLALSGTFHHYLFPMSSPTLLTGQLLYQSLNIRLVSLIFQYRARAVTKGTMVFFHASVSWVSTLSGLGARCRASI